MHDVVRVALTTLLNDQLSVVHHKAAHHRKADVQVSLKVKFRKVRLRGDKL